jgi:tetratricopeptide (TPR) repeat protein
VRYRIVWVGILLTLGGTAAAAALLAGGDDVSVPPYRYRTARPADPDGEIAFFEARVARNPEGALDRAALAAAYAAKAKRTSHAAWLARAEQEARRSLELLPHGNEGAPLVLARVAEARHEFQEALRLSGEVLRSRPGHPDALALQVTSNLGLGRAEDASRAADRLVERRPTLLAFTLRALTRVATGRDEEARHDFVKGIRLEDVGEAEVSAWARALLARFLLQRRRPRAAERLLREALRIRPGHALALHLLGQVYETRGNLREAERYYGWAAADAHDPAFRVRLARLKARQGDRPASDRLFQEAEGEMRAQGQRGPLARLLLERGQGKDQSEALTLAHQEAGVRRNPETLDTLAWALGKAGRWAEAYGVLQEALRTGVRDPDLYARAGWVTQALGRTDETRLYALLNNSLISR